MTLQNGATLIDTQIPVSRTSAAKIRVSTFIDTATKITRILAVETLNIRTDTNRYVTALAGLIFFIVLSILGGNFAHASTNSSAWSLEQRSPFNVKVQQAKTQAYYPLKRAKQAWKICTLVPHLKDAYWIGIDYGLVQHARALNITLELFEAGSYYGKDKQLSQLSHCMDGDYDAILLGTVDPKLLASFHQPITKPVIALVNRIDNHKVTTRIGVNWYRMGWFAGNFIKQDVEHSKAQQASVALLTGPEKQGGSDWVEEGIMAALQPDSTSSSSDSANTSSKSSKITISSIRHADNNRNLYRDQLYHLLKDQTPDYILGSAVAIEAAVGELAIRQARHGSKSPHSELEPQLSEMPQIKLVSSYLSPAVLRGLFRHRVAFSADDSVVLQGKLAIDVVVRELEGAKPFGDIGPAIQGLQGDVLKKHKLENSLAPAEFYPIYRVESEKKR
ncbi:TMAO reductase system periplasmic protein TorT [Shewanella psychropiezotolerans]|uniref:TMAO reductase system periplasmic protein TorT n=1 Tax=Shewanella psychropiezotolerans TaxID=2593655 RepID=UPI001E54D7F6|nr:TMAO reductase system periplasmic protein TorT [Shewanella psychropiezotolerans]